jgi:hypothetical protein
LTADLSYVDPNTFMKKLVVAQLIKIKEHRTIICVLHCMGETWFHIKERARVTRDKFIYGRRSARRLERAAH